MPEVTEPVPARRSRATTKSAGSTATESEAAESNKSTRKTARGTKAATTPAAKPEPDDPKPDLEAETTKGTRRRGRTRSQSVEVAPAPAPAPAPTTAKRRVGAKSQKTADTTTTQGAPVENGPPRSAADRAESPEAPAAAARARRGKAKSAAETDDESTGTAATGALRVARGRRPPTGTGAASNRAPAGKGRAVVIPSSGKGAARAAVGEKENTPERIHVKEEEDDKVGLPPVATKGVRARKGGAGVAPKALSEPEKDTTAPPKTRGPRTRAASGRK
jgi:hypothetical protein